MSDIPMFEPAKSAYVSGGRLVWIVAYAAALQAILSRPVRIVMGASLDASPLEPAASTVAATHADAALREFRKRNKAAAAADPGP